MDCQEQQVICDAEEAGGAVSIVLSLPSYQLTCARSDSFVDIDDVTPRRTAGLSGLEESHIDSEEWTVVADEEDVNVF
jgi:hypothetical protein